MVAGVGPAAASRRARPRPVGRLRRQADNNPPPRAEIVTAVSCRADRQGVEQIDFGEKFDEVTGPHGTGLLEVLMRSELSLVTLDNR